MYSTRSRMRPRIWIFALGVLVTSLSPTAWAQQQAPPEGPSTAQAPPEKPTCKPREERVGDVCVKRTLPPFVNGQTAPETPPISVPPPSERIPVCKKGQVVKGDKCVDADSGEPPSQ